MNEFLLNLFIKFCQDLYDPSFQDDNDDDDDEYHNGWFTCVIVGKERLEALCLAGFRKSK